MKERQAEVGVLKIVSVFVLLLAAIGCGGNSTPTTPSPTTFSLKGQVIDNTTFAGIAGASVLVVDGPNAGKSATTDAAGSYSFTGLQQSGFTANASASNYTSQSKSVTLTSDQTLSFQLTRSTPPPNFQGQYSGSYVTSGCTETSIGGFCAGLGMSVSRTLSLELSLQQSQTVVIGNLALGATSNIAATLGTSTMRGPFQGLIQSSDHLTGSSTALSQGNPFCVLAPVDPGLPGGGGYAICGITATVSAWDTTIAGNTLDGSFRLVFSGGAANAITGTATVSASLLQVTRR